MEWSDPNISQDSLRDAEKEIVELPNTFTTETYLAVYDVRSQVAIQAKLGLLTTLLVCVVLGAGAWLFSMITNDLVIKPIEIMI